MQWLSAVTSHTCVLVLIAQAPLGAVAQEAFSRFETFDRYDPTLLSYAVAGVEGEAIDPRTLAVSWETEDFVIPGNGGLDLAISRSFNRIAHTPSQMGHWYLGVPRIQIPTSPWRAPFDPALSAYGTFNAAWNNLYARTASGSQSICRRAGSLIDDAVTGSISRTVRGGIFFAAPILLQIPGQGARILLEKLPGATQFPASAVYVTTDNWYATCLEPAPGQSWGGFKVVSPEGVSYFFNFIQYLVPGDYAMASAGGWIEMGISRIVDRHGNRIDYNYDLDAGGTALLESITTSDGRRVDFEYYPGSVLGVDVQGSPLALISRINIRANGQSYPIDYSYCDFADFYIREIGCTPIELGADADLPVLHTVTYPNGTQTRYRYVADMYSANVSFDWGGFRFLLESVTLPTGGKIEYEYAPGYSAILMNSDSPAPRLRRRVTSGREVETGEWRYSYSYANHLERTSITGPVRREDYVFYEGLGTYEWLIARYPGAHAWPDTAPTDYDEVLGKLKRVEVREPAGGPVLTATDYTYALLTHVGKSYYDGNWLGWPTLVLAQTRPLPQSSVVETDYASDVTPRIYSVYTPPAEFDRYANPLVVHERGRDGGADGAAVLRRRDHSWYNNIADWVIGLPDRTTYGDAVIDYDYGVRGLPQRLNRDGVISTYEHDTEGNLTAVRWQQNGNAYFRTYANYRRGVPRSETTLLDSQTGQTEQITRNVDGLGHLLWEENGAGQRTGYSFDALGRLTQVVRPLVAPLNVSYPTDASGNWIAVEQQQSSRRRILALDGFGRATLVRDFLDSRPGEHAIASAWRYDAAGRLAYASEPFFWTGPAAQHDGMAYTYDWLNRPLTISHTDTTAARAYCYATACNTGPYAQAIDAALTHGFVMTDEEGYATAVEHVAFGVGSRGAPTRIVQQRSSGSAVSDFVTTTIERDLNQKVLKIAQGAAHAAPVERLFHYNGRQQLVAETHPESGTTTHSYNERGLLAATTTGAGRQRLYRYDGLGRTREVRYGSAAVDTLLEYSAAGQLQRVRNGVSEWHYTYDDAGQLRTEALTTGPDTLELRYAYDDLGHRTRIEHPTGRVTDLDVDELGRMRAVSDVVRAADYWPDGGLRSISFANDVVSTYTQTAAGWRAGQQVSGPGGGALADLVYDYDQRGNPLRIEDLARPGPPQTLAYDGLSQLVAASGYWGAGSLAYDATGNLLTNRLGNTALDYAYDSSTNRLTAVTNAGGELYDFGYDADGLQVSDGLYTFRFDSAARLAAIDELPDIDYEYDGHGRRTRIAQASGERIDAYDSTGKLVYSSDCQATNTQSDYIYLGNELVARADEPCTVGCHP